MRYWIVIASKEHVMRGVQGGFAQVFHGKKPVKIIASLMSFETEM